MPWHLGWYSSRVPVFELPNCSRTSSSYYTRGLLGKCPVSDCWTSIFLEVTTILLMLIRSRMTNTINTRFYEDCNGRLLEINWSQQKVNLQKVSNELICYILLWLSSGPLLKGFTILHRYRMPKHWNEGSSKQIPTSLMSWLLHDLGISSNIDTFMILTPQSINQSIITPCRLSNCDILFVSHQGNPRAIFHDVRYQTTCPATPGVV